MTAALSGRLPVAGAAPAGAWGAAAASVASAPIRIRTGHSYHVYFSIALGQRDARFRPEAARQRLEALCERLRTAARR